MYIPLKALQLAGNALAQGGLTLSNLDSHELICPFAVLEKDGERNDFVFEADSQQDAISAARQYIKDSQNLWDYWSFVWEGNLNLKGKNVDGLIVEIGFKRQTLPVRLAYPFVRHTSSTPLRLIGSPWFMVGQELQEDSDWSSEMEQVLVGVRQHEYAAPKWHSWVDSGS